jgi:hypothetical protein
MQCNNFLYSPKPNLFQTGELFCNTNREEREADTMSLLCIRSVHCATQKITESGRKVIIEDVLLDLK